MEDKCENCKQEINKNIPFILEELTSIGYMRRKFCNKKCLKEYVNKKGFFEKVFEKIRK